MSDEELGDDSNLSPWWDSQWLNVMVYIYIH